jgi:hypothetical protein
MSDDEEPGYVEKMQARSRLYINRDLTTPELLDEWSRNDIHTRVNALEEIAKEPFPTTIHKAAAKLTIQRQLKDRHELLRKAGR